MYLLNELTNAPNDYQFSTGFRVVNKFFLFFRLFLHQKSYMLRIYRNQRHLAEFAVLQAVKVRYEHTVGKCTEKGRGDGGVDYRKRTVRRTDICGRV